MLLHGHGVDESDLFSLEEIFPRDVTVAALRGPIVQDDGFRWFAAHDVGRPVAASLASGMAYVDGWLAGAAGDASGVWLVGFSGGALMAGALMLQSPQRFAGVAMLHGTLPFDAGVPVDAGRLSGGEVFYGYGEADAVIPRRLVERSRDYLRDESGANLELHAYRAGHEIPAQEQRDLARWFTILA